MMMWVEEKNYSIVENDKIEMVSYAGASIASAKEHHHNALKTGVDLPRVKEGCEKTILVNETASDSSVKPLRMLAEHRQRGYCRRDGLLLRRVLDKMGEETEMIVLPKSVRKKVLSLVHE